MSSLGSDVVFQCESLWVWLETMVEHQAATGCVYEVCDDPRNRRLGMRDVQTNAKFMLTVPAFGAGIGRFAARFVNDYLNTAEARERLARELSLGDFEFSEE